MTESWRTWWERRLFNLIPAYRGTGAKITYIARDWQEVRIKLPLFYKTRNYVGTIFGGSMYAAVDPIYMIMFIKIFGKEYVVWDKSAHIRFLRPGTSTLYATFKIPYGETESIKKELQTEKSATRTYTVDLKDAQGDVKASVEKELYFRKRDLPYSAILVRS